ncbi:MAG TPA: NUDIX domain-containing protein [Ardenticatenaceae bacterium]|nr:NUDIX domain-containing protein [Ardenticatenaceae bacterium]
MSVEPVVAAPPGWRYCPRCATELETVEIGGAVRPRCPACGFVYFADPKVAAGVLVERDGRILLGRRRWNPGMGLWYLPSGFVDYGESVVRAAAREVYEETGLTVQATELLGVWEYELGVAGLKGIVIFYRGRIVAGTAAPADDVEELGWFEPEALPELAFESHRQIIALWQRPAG